MKIKYNDLILCLAVYRYSSLFVSDYIQWRLTVERIKWVMLGAFIVPLKLLISKIWAQKSLIELGSKNQSVKFRPKHR